jgi:ADP-heptose:LPS heptosyltransferase
MWSSELPAHYEARKCRHRVVSLCKGLGLDLNPGEDKITKTAIGVGILKTNAIDVPLDLLSNEALSIFSNDFFDYVFSAGNMGKFAEPKEALREWWRVVKYGGHLILYEPDADYYPRIGTPGCAATRKSDLYWEDAWKILKSFGNAKLVSASRHNAGNEYSWQLVVKKRCSLLKRPWTVFPNQPKNKGQMCFPRQKKTDKEALVIRCAALGDTIWITPVLSQLKKDGYHVVVLANEYGAQAIAENPNIDEFIIQNETTDVPYEDLDDYWQELGKDFERVINLHQSIEGRLIKVEGSAGADWPLEERHRQCNYNFQDRTMEIAGYPEKKGCLPELYFSDMEHNMAKICRRFWDGKFMILWSLSGSAFHKCYPWAEYVARTFCKRHEDTVVFTVGDDTCKMLEWEDPYTHNKAGIWTVRQAFIMSQYADLVIGPDTGLMNAASCFETPKIIFMSTNTVENLTKYWKNCASLAPSFEDCDCYPCHKLMYSKDCPRGTIGGLAPKCMEHIAPDRVLDAMEVAYQQWRCARGEEINKFRIAAFTIADDEFTHRLAKRVETSFKYFHPDIPFQIFDINDECLILGRERNSVSMNRAFAIRPRFASRLLDDFDIVIYLDADTVVCDRLDEFIEGDYDVAGSLNISGLPAATENETHDFMNAGVCSVTSKQFCEDWTEAVYARNAGPSNQPSFNELARSDKYSLKVVDKEKVYYNERSRKYWKQLEVIGGRLMCNGRDVKVLHWAGGVERMQDKLSSSDFSDEVREFLNKVTGTEDFTMEKAKAVSQWGQ